MALVPASSTGSSPTYSPTRRHTRPRTVLYSPRCNAIGVPLARVGAIGRWWTPMGAGHQYSLDYE